MTASVLITGGTGTVGSHTTSLLQAADLASGAKEGEAVP
jgi:nucleoside-diphosphate-sugar epimerase